MVWKEVDLPTQEVIAYHLNVSWMNMHRVIYMDGRPHPPDYAAHSFMGFSTGAWDGNHMVVKTTHMKEQWLRRNGLPRSEKATLTERFIRHGDYLTWVFIIQRAEAARRAVARRASELIRAGPVLPPSRPQRMNRFRISLGNLIGQALYVGGKQINAVSA